MAETCKDSLMVYNIYEIFYPYSTFMGKKDIAA